MADDNLNLLILTVDAEGIGSAGDVVADRAVTFVDPLRFKALASASVDCPICGGSGYREEGAWERNRAVQKKLACVDCKGEGSLPVAPVARALPPVDLAEPKPPRKLKKGAADDGIDS